MRHHVGCHRQTLHRRPNRRPSLGISFVGQGDASQTPDPAADGPSLHQWRSIQGKQWLELHKVQHNIQHALNKTARLWAIVGLSLSDSDVGTHEGAPSQHRSAPVHPEQELWRRNCVIFLGACAQGRAEEKAPCCLQTVGQLR